MQRHLPCQLNDSVTCTRFQVPHLGGRAAWPGRCLGRQRALSNFVACADSVEVVNAILESPIGVLGVGSPDDDGSQVPGVHSTIYRISGEDRTAVKRRWLPAQKDLAVPRDGLEVLRGTWGARWVAEGPRVAQRNPGITPKENYKVSRLTVSHLVVISCWRMVDSDDFPPGIRVIVICPGIACPWTPFKVAAEHDNAVRS